MKKIITPTILLFLIIFLINPFHLWMPGMTEMVLTGFIIFVFGIFSVFFWNESPRDEREVIISLKANKLAFFGGASVLLIGIVVNEIYDSTDHWLLISLGVMVLFKIISLWWFENKN